MARKAAPRAPTADRILDSALALAATHRWRDITMEMIAADSGATLSRVRSFYPTRAAFVTALMRRIDDAVLAGHDPADAAEPVRERVLDVLMRRFDALSKYRDALRSIARDGGGDVATLLCAGAALFRSMAWCLEAAGVSTAGPGGMIRVKGLTAIYLSAIPVWLRDDSPDLSRTMATLDRNLKRAEGLLKLCAGRRRTRPEEATAEH